MIQMRLILSRKGFDSASGGCPSPVLADGSMIALPIPDTCSTIRYDQLAWADRNLGELVETLTGGKQKSNFCAHLDPDVRFDLMPRDAGWRPALGQEGASQAHLLRQGVSAGDLFLFWGLFQRVANDLTRLGSPFHAIWGWLQVGEAAEVRSEILPALDSSSWRWATSHPHVSKSRKNPNWLYVASDRLVLPASSPSGIPGAGFFGRFRPELQLTANPEEKLSRWALPAWFEPRDRKPLTYHADRSRWTRQGDRVLLQTVGRGQEFVLDVNEYPEAIEWVGGLLEDASKSA